ncbi:TraL conjugative transposon family protein [uncultured Muribaculum sp.]
MVVTILLSAFILAAFFVFGNACYKMGAGHARQSIEIEHIRQLELPTKTMSHETD